MLILFDKHLEWTGFIFSKFINKNNRLNRINIFNVYIEHHVFLHYKYFLFNIVFTRFSPLQQLNIIVFGCCEMKFNISVDKQHLKHNCWLFWKSYVKPYKLYKLLLSEGISWKLRLFLFILICIILAINKTMK